MDFAWFPEKIRFRDRYFFRHAWQVKQQWHFWVTYVGDATEADKFYFAIKIYDTENAANSHITYSLPVVPVDFTKEQIIEKGLSMSFSNNCAKRFWKTDLRRLYFNVNVWTTKQPEPDVVFEENGPSPRKRIKARKSSSRKSSVSTIKEEVDNENDSDVAEVAPEPDRDLNDSLLRNPNPLTPPEEGDANADNEVAIVRDIHKPQKTVLATIDLDQLYQDNDNDNQEN